jgi:CRISPR/Cas system-associated protein Csx1
MRVVLVTSPIGDPCDYQLVKYYIENIESGMRSVKELRRRYSYTGAALKDFVSEFWENPKVVDALYIAPLSLVLKTCRGRRVDAFGNFLKLIKSKGTIGYDDLAKIAREYVEMLEPETYGKVVVVPALLTSMRGGQLYTFVGGEEALNAALAIVVKSVYQKLKELRGEKVDILLDTTHGLNYLVPYVVEGVYLAASLYYLTLEKGEVTVWRYNSDPIEEGVETAKLHL